MFLRACLVVAAVLVCSPSFEALAGSPPAGGLGDHRSFAVLDGASSAPSASGDATRITGEDSDVPSTNGGGEDSDVPSGGGEDSDIPSEEDIPTVDPEQIPLPAAEPYTYGGIKGWVYRMLGLR